MLMLLLSTGNDRYALHTQDVIEVVPQVEMRTLPRAPGYVVGLLNYRALMVPVVDVCSLMHGSPCQPRLSTRIVLVNYPVADGAKHVLGLLAESVTDTVRVDERDLVPANIEIEQAPYLGKVFVVEGEMIQCLRVEPLIPQELRHSLFVNEAESV